MVESGVGTGVEESAGAAAAPERQVQTLRDTIAVADAAAVSARFAEPGTQARTPDTFGSGK